MSPQPQIKHNDNGWLAGKIPRVNELKLSPLPVSILALNVSALNDPMMF